MIHQNRTIFENLVWSDNREISYYKNIIKILFFVILKFFLLKRVSFLTYDTADDIITSLEIIEKLLFLETDFWRDNYLKKFKIIKKPLLKLIKTPKFSFCSKFQQKI